MVNGNGVLRFANRGNCVGLNTDSQARKAVHTPIGVSVSDRAIYHGYGLQLVDDKGRVAIPSPLRPLLIANGAPNPEPKAPPEVVIAVHESGECLMGFDVVQMKEKVEALQQRALAHAGPDGAPNDEILRRSMALDVVAFDASGRFIMPGYPRGEVGIGKYAFFYGLGRHFEIWDPRRAIQSPTATDRLKSMVRHFMAEKGETL